MSTTYPIPRSTRQQVFVAEAEQTVFGPLDFIIFDDDDVEVWIKVPAGHTYSLVDPALYAVEAVGTFPGSFTIDFAEGLEAGTSVVIKGARVQQRLTDVTQGGTVNSLALERELDRLAITQQELRRDINALLTSTALPVILASGIANDSSGAPGGTVADALADLDQRISEAEQHVVALQSAVNSMAQVLSGTSTTELIVAPGIQVLTTQANKDFAPGRDVKITADADPENVYMAGTVTSYVGTALTVFVTAYAGSGTYDAWTIRVSGVHGVGTSGADGQRLAADVNSIVPRTIWVEMEAFQPGIVQRETSGGTRAFNSQYLEEKIKALYERGYRRFLIHSLSINGRTYTEWDNVPVDPNGDPFAWWWDHVSPTHQPNTENFDVLAKMIEVCAGLEGAYVIVGLGQHNDVGLLNDIYSVETLGSPDPNTFGKTVAERKAEEIARYQAEAAELFARFGSSPGFGGFYCSHETDHIQSSAPFYGAIFGTDGDHPALRSYGRELHFAVASPIDLVDNDTIADAINDCKATWLWAQTHAGYGLNWNTGLNAHVSSITITGAATHLALWRDVINRAKGRSGGAYTPLLGADIENWRIGEKGVGTLTFGATTGSGITVTGSGSFFTEARNVVGKTINVRAGQVTGLATITARTNDNTVTVDITEDLANTSVLDGFWSLVPDLTDSTVDAYPASASEVEYEIRTCAPYCDDISIYAEPYTDPGNLSLRLVQSQGPVTDYRDRALSQWVAHGRNLSEAQRAARFYAWHSQEIEDPGANALMRFNSSTKKLELETASNIGLAASGVNSDIIVMSSLTVINSGPLAGLRNRIINGCMRINRRGLSTAGDDTYCFDRWYALVQTASIGISQVTDIQDGWTHAIRLTQSQATAQRMGLAQIIEAINCKDLRGCPCVLSARLRCSANADVRYAVIEWTGTADVVTSDVVNDWTSSTYTAGNFFISSDVTIKAVGEASLTANTPTLVALQAGTLSSSFNNIIVFFWTEGAAVQNVTLDIGNVQFEPGNVSSLFERRPYQIENELCNRYYRRAPRGTVGQADTASTVMFGLTFETPMRIAPVITLLTSSPTFNNAGGNTVTGSNSTITASGSDPLGVFFIINGMTVVSAFPYIMQADTVDLRAEL